MPTVPARHSIGDSPASASGDSLPNQPTPRASSRGVLPLFATTLLASASLVFVLEPLFARMVLPLLGGAPAVWNTCVVFYQLGLVAGYLYAHGITRWLTPRRQVAVQLAVMLAALLVLPVHPAANWTPRVDRAIVPGMLLLLTISVGLPFFAVSTIAPLLQNWFARTGHKQAADPYFLYAASNLGSFAGLVAYPFLIEPRLRVVVQSRAWTAGYAVLILLVALCGWRIWDRPAIENSGIPAAVGPGDGVERSPAVTTRQRLRWLLLAAVPASLMLSVTTYASTDIAAVPLMWVVPLGLYLLTFVLAFARRQALPAWLASAILPLLVAVSALSIVTDTTRPIAIVLALHLTTFFLATIVCHTQLARSRPAVTQLTEYYVWIAVGGALGGLFNVLVAPLVFVNTLEYPLALVVACALRTVPKLGRSRRWWMVDIAAALIPGGQLAVLLLATRSRGLVSELPTVEYILFGVPLVVGLVFWPWPRRFALGLLGYFAAANVLGQSPEPILHAERSFFGVHRVVEQRGLHVLMNGTTNHGAQPNDPARRLEPITYYRRSGPIGQLFEQVRRPEERWSVGVVGLGTGSVSLYARPGEQWTYFEINRAVERMARDPRLFTLLESSAGHPRVVLGDARLSLRAMSDRYDALVVDAFSSDAIPVHLITREAFQLYFEHLNLHGRLALHISNRFLSLAPVTAHIATAEGLTAMLRNDYITVADDLAGFASSSWIMLARNGSDLEPLPRDKRWNFIEGEATEAWTDDFSNIWSVFSWK